MVKEGILTSFVRSAEDQERFISRMSEGSIVFMFAKEFWLMKLASELPPGTTIDKQTPEELAEFFSTRYVEDDNTFVFSPGRFLLGKTRESVIVPADEMWHLRIHAYSEEGGKLPLLVHLNAPIINPLCTDNITLELRNISPQELKIDINNVYMFAQVVKVEPPAIEPTGTFRHQSLEDNPFPDLSKFDP